MASTIAVLKQTGKHSNELRVAEFSGGKIRGKMIQLTQGANPNPRQPIDSPGFIQLTREDAEKLLPILQEWLKGEKL